MDALGNIILVFIGFIFSFFLPGFIGVQTFFRKIPLIEKIPLIMLLSLFLSTITIYFFSLLWGFNENTILFAFVLYLLMAVFMLFLFLLHNNHWLSKTPHNMWHTLISEQTKEVLFPLFGGLVVFLIFFVALFPAIFTQNGDSIVMSAENWQDTAMHMSIIESLTQGNFPPQSPYFSGYPLNYYYFVDFHSAILGKLFGQFFPRVLVYDNPFFVFTFFLSVYALTFFITTKKNAAIIAAILGTFTGNFLFIKFLQDVGLANLNLPNIIQIMAQNGYTMEYGQLMQMVPMADLFLQNRPMMVGLPAVTLIILSLLRGFKSHQTRFFILSGFLTGCLIKFQLFALGTSLISFGIFFLVYLNLKSIVRSLKQLSAFLLPIIILGWLFLMTSPSTSSLVETVVSNFYFGPWDKAKDFWWYFTFPFANYGVVFSCFLIFLSFFLWQKKFHQRVYLAISILGLVLFIIPHIIRFTIYDGDMFKFFYFMMIPLAVVSGIVLSSLKRLSFLGAGLIIIILFIGSFTSLLAVSWSYFNKNGAYNLEKYHAGLWIREQTPQRSVFVTMPTVHSAVSEIGGRLRVLSYTVWPYTHGFNVGPDNVFTRQEDIENIFSNSQNPDMIDSLMKKYYAQYIYVGSEERNEFPQAEVNFDSSPVLTPIFKSDEVSIYQRKK